LIDLSPQPQALITRMHIIVVHYGWTHYWSPSAAIVPHITHRPILYVRSKLNDHRLIRAPTWTGTWPGYN